MDVGGLGDLRLSELLQYLGRMSFPADKQEVASTAENEDARLVTWDPPHTTERERRWDACYEG